MTNNKPHLEADLNNNNWHKPMLLLNVIVFCGHYVILARIRMMLVGCGALKRLRLCTSQTLSEDYCHVEVLPTPGPATYGWGFARFSICYWDELSGHLKSKSTMALVALHAQSVNFHAVLSLQLDGLTMSGPCSPPYVLFGHFNSRV